MQVSPLDYVEIVYIKSLTTENKINSSVISKKLASNTDITLREDTFFQFSETLENSSCIG
ncbi:hypothetical protein STEG23_031195, partial [Scotinomys teguina]